MTTMSNTEFDSMPPDLPLTIERRPDGITYTTHPIGIFKGSKGLLVGCVIWNLLSLIVPAFIAFGCYITNTVPDLLNFGGFFTIAILIVNWIVGIWFALYILNQGKRYAIIDIVGQPPEFLLVTHKSIYGVKQHQWHVEEIDRVRCGPSGMSVSQGSYDSGTPINELQIQLADGKIVGQLSQLADEHLIWLGEHITQTLEIPQNPTRPFKPDQSFKTDIQFNHAPTQTTINIPCNGIYRYLLMIILLIATCLVMAGIGIAALIPNSPLFSSFQGTEAIIAAVIIGVLLLFPVGILSFVLERATVQTTINLIGKPVQTLSITKNSIFGTKQKIWQVNEIDHITWGDSDIVSKGKPVEELQIHPVNGKSFGLLSQRNHQELAMLASELQEAIKPSATNTVAD